MGKVTRNEGVIMSKKQSHDYSMSNRQKLLYDYSVKARTESTLELLHGVSRSSRSIWLVPLSWRQHSDLARFFFLTNFIAASWQSRFTDVAKAWFRYLYGRGHHRKHRDWTGKPHSHVPSEHGQTQTLARMSASIGPGTRYVPSVHFPLASHSQQIMNVPLFPALLYLSIYPLSFGQCYACVVWTLRWDRGTTPSYHIYMELEAITYFFLSVQ